MPFHADALLCWIDMDLKSNPLVAPKLTFDCLDLQFPSELSVSVCFFAENRVVNETFLSSLKTVQSLLIAGVKAL